jgi:hypothetical protein
MDKEEKYLEFAANLSFFEFIQEEFYSAKFKVDTYKNEIEAIEKIIDFSKANIKSLLSEYPKVFDIFEQIFQLYRFTNTQLINFLFDIDVLNSVNKDEKIEYIIANLKIDKNFKTIFDSELNKNDVIYSEINELYKQDKNLLIKILKESVVKFIDKAIKERKYIYERIEKNENTRERLANYLFDNLKIEEMIESIKIQSYLKYKKIPKDTKSIHGKFGTIKIKEILEKLGYINCDKKLPKVLEENIKDPEKYAEFKNKKIYVTEKYIRDIFKKKTNKPKRFDFIIINDLKITDAIETNFYSTSGTKIGINEDEYTDLNEVIKEKNPKINFIWVTDGNYWLKNDGEERYKRCLDKFGSNNILNYNQLELLLQSRK